MNLPEFSIKKPVTVLIGDLALLHDLNSLAILKKMGQPLTIVVLNNDGGGIFSFLPIARFPATFEKAFGTPHGYQFTAVARLFGLRYEQPKTMKNFIRVYQKAVAAGRSTLIEVKTNRQENVQVHQDWQNRVRLHVEQKLK